jgi:hypothetical protein
MTESDIHYFLAKGWSYVQTKNNHEFHPPRGRKKVIYSKDHPMVRLSIHQLEENAYTYLDYHPESLSRPILRQKKVA